MAFLGLGKQQKTVGLDIGSGLIKLAVVDHGSGRPTLQKVAVTNVLADAIVEGEIMDPGVVAEAVKGLLVSAGVRQKRAVVAVGGRDVIVKKIQVDRMNEADAYDVVRWEAQQYVPFDIAGVELDFQVLDPDGTGLQMDVLLVAAKRELIETKLNLLADAGLEGSIVDVDAFALHNAFELNYPSEQQGVTALINIGHEVTNVNVVQDGVPLLTRDLSIGTRKFREDLQRERGLPAEEAEQMLQGYERTPELEACVQNRGDEIAVGVERAAAFLQTSSRDAKIRRVFVSGGGGRVPGLGDAMAERLRIPVELANPVQALDVHEDAFEGLNVDEVAPLLMQVIGLALRREKE
jgi:type IV pilus assembly protein PilM